MVVGMVAERAEEAMAEEEMAEEVRVVQAMVAEKEGAERVVVGSWRRTGQGRRT